jgi:hypothetical protein
MWSSVSVSLILLPNLEYERKPFTPCKARSKIAGFAYFNITIIILDIIRRPVFYLKTTFQRLDSVSVFRWNLLKWAQ